MSNFAIQTGGALRGFIVQVPSGDARITNSDNSIGFTYPQIHFLQNSVNTWTIAKTGNLNDWWNGSNIYSLPGGAGVLPNNNVWTSWGDLSHDGAFVYPWGQASNTGVSTPFFSSQSLYVDAKDLHGVGGTTAGETPITTGFPDQNSSNPMGTGIDYTTIYFDGTLYYPRCFVVGTVDFSTNKSNVAGTVVGIGTLSILGLTTTIWGNSLAGYSGNITWTVNSQW